MRATKVISLILATALLTSAAGAKPPLRETEIDSALLSVGLADEIRKSCPDISARLIRALSTLRAIKARALALGYSEREIDAYRSSPEEKARIRALGEQRLEAEGVRAGQPESYCDFGRREIAKKSQIGELLRAN